MRLRALAWAGAGALVVLAARAIAYALSPDPLARTLEREAGGPRLPVVALVSLSLSLVFACAVLWLAALGVRERRVLAALPKDDAPRLRLGRVAVRAAFLFGATTLAFGALESYLHHRAGLGWHALHCLSGPVHVDALPILAALSLVAAATAGAVEHALAWMRSAAARLAPARPRVAARVVVVVPDAPQRRPSRSAHRRRAARAPPRFAC